MTVGVTGMTQPPDPDCRAALDADDLADVHSDDLRELLADVDPAALRELAAADLSTLEALARAVDPDDLAKLTDVDQEPLFE